MRYLIFWFANIKYFYFVFFNNTQTQQQSTRSFPKHLHILQLVEQIINLSILRQAFAHLTFFNFDVTIYRNPFIIIKMIHVLLELELIQGCIFCQNLEKIPLTHLKNFPTNSFFLLSITAKKKFLGVSYVWRYVSPSVCPSFSIKTLLLMLES